MPASGVRRRLAIFAKAPIVGRAKTRLAAETSPEFAALVACASLLDTLVRTRSLAVPKSIVFAPEDAETWFRDHAPAEFERIPQTTGDLGERLSTFATNAFAEPLDALVVIGSDSPTLPVEYIGQAYQRLEASDVVFGPASDGGYYLVAMRRPCVEIFREIPWSSDRVLLDSASRARDAGLSHSLLPEWHDVDTLADWRRLCGQLQATRAGGGEDFPNLRALIDQQERYSADDSVFA